MPKPTPRIDFADLKSVEIFRSGTWNGIRFTDRDLQDMVDAFGEVGFTPPLKLDEGNGRETHSDGGPAYGWVEGLRKEGDRLVADFRDVPDDLIELIKKRRFDSVSAEILPDFKRGEKTYRRVLSAVELMGASIPAVAGLKPPSQSLGFSEDLSGLEVDRVAIPASAFGDDSMANDKPDTTDERLEEMKSALEKAQAELKAAKEEVATFKAKDTSIKLSDTPEYKTLTQKLADSQAEIDRLKESARATKLSQVVANCAIPALRRHVHIYADLASTANEDKVLTFNQTNKDGNTETVTVKPWDAVESFVRDVNAIIQPMLKDEFQSKFERPEEVDDPAETSFDAGEKIHKLTLEKQKADPKLDYAVAFNQVLAENEDLRRKYGSE